MYPPNAVNSYRKEPPVRQTPAIVVFSHLRWDFVFQRPQHLLSRLARKRRVIFIEEPQRVDSTEAHWRRSTPEPNVLVCRPCTAIPQHGFHDEQMPTLQ